MPFYEFVCEKCKHKQNIMRSIDKRNDPANCDKCNGELVRQLSIPSFKFIGTGFYTTDYKEQKEAVKELKDMKKKRDSRRKDES